MIRFLVGMLSFFGLGMLVVGSAAAAAKPLPKFWSVSQCEQVLLAHDHALPTAEGHYFHIGQVICVGTGGSPACRWTPDHRTRRFSEFSVFTRGRDVRSDVRSFTIATRAEQGLIRVGHHAGDDSANYPADFYMSPASVRLIALDSTLARFRSIVAAIAARLTHWEDTTGCT